MRRPRLTATLFLSAAFLLAYATLVVGKAPVPTGNRTVSDRFVAGILQEVRLPELVLTPNDQLVFTGAGMPLMSARMMDDYSPAAGPDSPLRGQVLKARQILWAVSGREPPEDLLKEVKKLKEGQSADLSSIPLTFPTPADLNKFKQQCFQDSRQLARLMSLLSEAVEELQENAKPGENEPRRWRVHHDLVHACLLLQITQLFEWQSQLGLIRKEALPFNLDLKGGFQLVRVQPLTGDTEGKVRGRIAHKILEQISNDHPGTPWDTLATCLRKVPLGLAVNPVQ